MGTLSTQLACARASRCMNGDRLELSGLNSFAAMAFVKMSPDRSNSIRMRRNSVRQPIQSVRSVTHCSKHNPPQSLADGIAVPPRAGCSWVVDSNRRLAAHVRFGSKADIGRTSNQCPLYPQKRTSFLIIYSDEKVLKIATRSRHEDAPPLLMQLATGISRWAMSAVSNAARSLVVLRTKVKDRGWAGYCDP